MKRTLIALLALTGASVAAESITIGSYYTKDGKKYDAVNNFADKTESDIISLSGLIGDNIDNLAFTVSKSVTLNTSDMLVNDSTLAIGSQLTLTGFSYIGRTDSKHEALGSTVSITIGGTTYISSAATHNGYDDNSDYGLVTYTFNVENSPTFKLGETLTFDIAYSTPPEGTTNQDPYKLPMGAFKTLGGTTFVHDGVWQGAFQIKATAVIPEPTTATLSLLALAGLAARRRRK